MFSIKKFSKFSFVFFFSYCVLVVWSAQISHNRIVMDDASITASGTKFTMTGDFELTGSFNYVPRGFIGMWSGSVTPAGFALCDGTNGTPDLRGRFVVGAGSGAGLTPR